VDHAQAYQQAMQGVHGKQLDLAKMEGYGKDDPLFDPFAFDEELDSLLDAARRAEDVDEIPEAEFKEVAEESDAAAAGPEDIVEDDDDDDVDDNAFAVTDQVEESGGDSLPGVYNNDGSLRRKPSQVATLRAGYPSGGLFAVIAMAGSQYKVTADDVLIVNLLKPVTTFTVGSVHTLTNEDVLLLSSSHYTLVGMPFVAGAEVDVLVEEITKDHKVVIFHKRRKKNSKRKRGFRRDVTMLRILDIRPPAAYEEHYYTPRIDPGSEDHSVYSDVVAA
jgi:large subunit ribosomal protein L21